MWYRSQVLFEWMLNSRHRGSLKHSHAQATAGQANPRSPGIGETRLAGGSRAHPAWFSVTLQTEKDPLLLLKGGLSPETTVEASISRKQAALIFISVCLLPRFSTNNNQSRTRGLFKCWQPMAHAWLVCLVYTRQTKELNKYAIIWWHWEQLSSWGNEKANSKFRLNYPSLHKIEK